jgi:glycosyltransferase involved in cell wall biosynthesis
MTPWADGEILENRLREVARVQRVPRDGSYFPSLDRSRVNVLLAANVNETLLDGSTIWLKTLASTLSGIPGVNVYVASNAIHVSNGVTAELFGRSNVAKIDLVASGSERVADIAKQIRAIDRTSGGFDLIIVRGIDFAKVIVDKSTRDRSIYYGAGMFRRGLGGEVVTDEAALGVAARCSGIIFQNAQMEKLFRERELHYRGDCYDIAPCVEEGALLAAASVQLPALKPHEQLVVYAGKLIREYGILELLRAVGSRLSAGCKTRLVILGNKFDGREPEYQALFEAELAALGDAVTWLPAVSPSTALAWVSRADAVWGWRLGEFENSHFEISTKMVEAISCGSPIVLYPAAANVALMGESYPGFAETPADCVQALGRLLSEGRGGFAALAARLDGRFSANRVYEPLLRRVRVLARDRELSSTSPCQSQSILVAAHDFRFFADIEASLLREGHAVSREYWKSHTARYVYGQAQAVDTADVIFCEWCLGNAVWWSNNLPAGKRLFIRLHLQEIHTEHPAKVDFSRVEKVIFISPHVMRQAMAKFNIPPEKCQVIPISVRLEPGPPSTRVELEVRRNTLAMVGLTPWRKRPDLALDLLTTLRQRYPEVVLHLKGHTPSEYGWMNSRKDELSRYQSFFREVAKLEKHGIVRLSGYDEQLEGFYRGTGWVLSLSDFEGCHTAVAEGGAMGCLPLMTNWGGADEVYPPDLVQHDLQEVVRFFDAHYESFAEHSADLQLRFQRAFGIDRVFETWRALLLSGGYGASRHSVAVGS